MNLKRGKITEVFVRIKIEKCPYCDNDLKGKKCIDLYDLDGYGDNSSDTQKPAIRVCERCFYTFENTQPHKLNLVFDPNSGKLSKHISINSYGLAEPKSEIGKYTIYAFNLNDKKLRVERELQVNKTKLYQELSYLTEKNIYKEFLESIKKLNKIAESLSHLNDEEKQYLANLLYSNVITILETYLSDTMIKYLMASKSYQRAFVENSGRFGGTFKKREIFSEYETITTSILKLVVETTFHNVEIIERFYLAVFDIKVVEIKGYEEIKTGVTVRHDLVHRNGKDKLGKRHKLNDEAVINLSNYVQLFVDKLNSQLPPIG